jgi:hypothetical protein
LLGRDWLESFKIGFQSINPISKPSEVDRVIRVSKFPKVFSGKLGRFKKNVNLMILKLFSKIARKFVTCIATSVPSERLFSKTKAH